ncbi:hypothetical protein H5410_033832, partial [Solanum commersonii]
RFPHSVHLLYYLFSVISAATTDLDGKNVIVTGLDGDYLREILSLSSPDE